jgi:hypothetical protein
MTKRVLLVLALLVGPAFVPAQVEDDAEEEYYQMPGPPPRLFSECGFFMDYCKERMLFDT